MRGRILLCADGATSRLASHMGYCTEPPRGVCSRAFVEGGTHNTDFDGDSGAPVYLDGRSKQNNERD